METKAIISADKAYRYSLCRTWDTGLPRVTFVGLNPSTADEIVDDPTIRRMIKFSRTWGGGGICVANLFAFRTPRPDELLGQADAIGPDNDAHLIQIAQQLEGWPMGRPPLVVVCWGNASSFKRRSEDVLQLFRTHRTVLHCLGRTKRGAPRHPLYVPANIVPQPY